MGGMFWRLLLGTVVMLAAGYSGEAGFCPAQMGFFVGMCGWGFILFEIFMGEAGSVAASGGNVNKHVQASFSTMRFIVTVGWSIYPLGYFFGYLMGSVQDSTLNLVYNLADLVNKIAFCLAIWNSAKNSTMFWRLLLGTVVMLAAGYSGEAGFVPAGMGFFVGMCGWGFILFEIFMGEAGSVAASGGNVNKHVQASFSTMRFIVTVGWSIYPLG